MIVFDIKFCSDWSVNLCLIERKTLVSLNQLFKTDYICNFLGTTNWIVNDCAICSRLVAIVSFLQVKTLFLECIFFPQGHVPHDRLTDPMKNLNLLGIYTQHFFAENHVV